ncbi:MAG: hypothetical protein WD851_05010 [Pirellulales bacterium]
MHLPGDYNGDGRVLHADYGVLGDTFGSTTNLQADGNENYVIDVGDYDFWKARFGMNFEGVTPVVAPFAITATPMLDGNTQWILSFPNVGHALSAHVNITARYLGNTGLGPRVVSAVGTPNFQDVPGFLTTRFGSSIREGIYFPHPLDYSDVDVFAAVGTRLGQPVVGQNLPFLVLVTDGTSSTTLSIEGGFGIGRDFLGEVGEYSIEQSATFGSSEPGNSPFNPLLPQVVSTGDFFFPDVPSGMWFDPPLVPGFEYIMDSDSLFTSIMEFPPGFDEPFHVSAEGLELGTFTADQSVDFVALLGHGVERFTVSGIAPAVDAEDPTAFPLRIAFSTPTASFRMVAIPEPSSMVLGAIALVLTVIVSSGRKLRFDC